ncbi:hypothetical protein ASAC_1375 [Acidilobus saccharovorans 345-15]|uniref:HAD family hydrolase n=1 Tax=Acidilobus saccharovorans (strain DSM 16705 / JCM 18335 / VKM B-2471 / 345-15) TaxID=666510 RepID=D9PYZ3_ACIS3|nr:HAD family hydrolase [Acidilobus saccharovorans]ADL19780.1 hypothetical protein ASAC_1375 [Acidilobus saccharovorans 345-15]
MIRAVTFDVWDTLLNLKVAREAMIGAVSRATGRPVDDVRKAVSEADRHVRRLRQLRGLSGAESVRASVSYLASSLGYGGDLLQVINDAVASLDVSAVAFQDSLEAVRDVRGLGLRVGVLGNTLFWSSSATRRLLSRAFGDAFDFMGFADEIGHSKPSPEAFLAAAKGLGVDVSELVHVGDRASEDLGGALAAGLRAVLVARGRVSEAIVLPELGFAVVPDLRGLRQVILELSTR